MNNNNNIPNNNKNNNYTSEYNNIPLQYLPLRPSSIRILNQRGFDTVQDVCESKNIGGYTNLAAELNCPINTAHSIYQDIFPKSIH